MDPNRAVFRPEEYQIPDILINGAKAHPKSKMWRRSYAPVSSRNVRSLLKDDVSAAIANQERSFGCLALLAEQNTRACQTRSASTSRWSFVASFHSHCAVYMGISVIISPFLLTVIRPCSRTADERPVPGVQG